MDDFEFEVASAFGCYYPSSVTKEKPSEFQIDDQDRNSCRGQMAANTLKNVLKTKD
ncbi:hypothetical protein KIN20_013369 [Parelaphostrongylus tenuis]|uniref:Uncharacterized protein n=1 Tax=Parelaphostrongylus tenuis TaxID=148309 RepID=A0AAD5MGJ6_PARTN|nr:hypothetical protein KIN20_013369 [Parelaphostrongylus tenuis]